jgi:hypothetical protein
VTAETWPAGLIPNDISWGIWAHTLGLESPWTRSGQYVELQGARWQLSMSFRALDETQQRELAGFLDHLRGSVGIVAMPTWVHETKQGSAAGTILATAAAHAKLIGLTGVTGAGVSFKRGDLLGIAGRLHRVTADATHDGGTIAALSIAPPLRASATGAAVSLANLTCPMRLVGDGDAVGRFRPKFGDFSLTWVEALP